MFPWSALVGWDLPMECSHCFRLHNLWPAVFALQLLLQRCAWGHRRTYSVRCSPLIHILSLRGLHLKVMVVLVHNCDVCVTRGARIACDTGGRFSGA
jgi:hypothetical protein